MKKLAIVLTLAALTIFLVRAEANDIYPSITLSQIKCIDTSEHHYDQVYMAITKFYPDHQRSYTRIPTFPRSWIIKDGESVQDIEVWSGTIKKGHSVSLILAVIEQDLSHYDPDDLIGSIKVVLRNDNGKLKATWSIPNSDKELSVIESEKGNRVETKMVGDGSIYEMSLVAEHK